MFLPGRNLMIVAHPDDETLFGFKQLSNPDLYVVCATNKENTVRSEEFHNVLDIFYIGGEIWDFKDEWGAGFDSLTLTNKIYSLLGKRKFDNFITHNEDGEYGHTQHRALNFILKSIIPTNLFVFNRSEDSLPFNVLYSKMTILKDIYKSQSDLYVWDWYDQDNHSNRMMNWVVYEDLKRIK